MTEFSPQIRLVNAFSSPYDNMVATARTCYSSRIIRPEEVAADEPSRNKRDAIAESIYRAGHHTTLQHASFQFCLERVSRHCLWSFLHSHPYYNSEQVSQRYVEVREDRFAAPCPEGPAAAIFARQVKRAMAVYGELIRVLTPFVGAEYSRIFPQKDTGSQAWQSAVKKRAQEVARYVLPVAAYAHLYHTVSGLTLHRYHRLIRQYDTPAEQKAVVEAMIDAVRGIDPLFFKRLEDPLPLEKTPEFLFFSERGSGASSGDRRAFLKEFDGALGGRISRLADHGSGGAGCLADSVRSVLGVARAVLSDEEALALLLDPKRNVYLSQTLNVNAHAKLTRCLNQASFTFQKKISHSADSQDQRHRMTPGARPVLWRHFDPAVPDYVVPGLIRASAEASEIYRRAMDETWKAIGELLGAGAGEEAALYLLPNAFPIRFYESGDLLNLHHKWTKRLCYTAQEEIWRMCLDEVRQVSEFLPSIGRYLLPPCGSRERAGVKPFCPEGERYCGQSVWMKDLDAFERLI